MNILVIGKFYTEGFGLHIAETLEDMGHSVRRFEPGYRSDRLGGRIGYRIDQVGRVVHSASDSLPAVRARRMRELWKIAEQAPLDVVVVIYDYLWPSEVEELKKRTGAVVALWFPDTLANFDRALFMNASYDGIFFKDPFIVQMLQRVLASPVHYLPECFNPDRHSAQDATATELDAYRCDITTAGSQHSWRVAIFKHLTEYDIKIWGKPTALWMNAGPVTRMYQGRPVYNRDKALAFRASKIVLNTLYYGEIWGVNVRTFEIAGIGAFQLVDWRPGIEQLFAVGKELVCFRNIGELKEKIDYWLPRDEERMEIAAAGMRRAHAEHTYRLRLELLLDTMAGRSRGFEMPDIQGISL